MLRNCQVCNKGFVTYPSRIKIGKGKYCTGCRVVSRFQKGHVPATKGRKGIHYSRSTEFKKGLTPWNKGIKTGVKHSKQFKRGIPAWNKGLKGFCAGEKHWNWKGGITPLRKKLHSTGALKQWRISVLKRDNYACQRCGGKERLEVDHIKRWHEYPELRHDIDNGRTLCRDCHMKTQTYGNFRHGRYVKKTVQTVLL